MEIVPVTDFDNVVLNQGEGFNKASGVFTARVSGLYFLVYTQVKPRGLNTVQIGLRTPKDTNSMIQMSQIQTHDNLDAWGSVGVQIIFKLDIKETKCTLLKKLSIMMYLKELQNWKCF